MDYKAVEEMMGKFFKAGLLLLMVIFMFMLAGPALAQDAAPVTPTVPGASEVPPEWTQFLANVTGLLDNLTAVPALAAGVLIFTNAIKAILATFKVEMSGSRAVALALGVQVVVWIIYQLSRRGGFDLQFQQWYDAAATLISTLLPLVLTLFAGHYAYEKTRDNPVLGYGGYRKPATPEGDDSPKG